MVTGYPTRNPDAPSSQKAAMVGFPMLTGLRQRNVRELRWSQHVDAFGDRVRLMPAAGDNSATLADI